MEWTDGLKSCVFLFSRCSLKYDAVYLDWVQALSFVVKLEHESGDPTYKSGFVPSALCVLPFSKSLQEDSNKKTNRAETFG